jgi:hypothetical protein
MIELYLRHEVFEIEPLYMDTRWKDLYDLGPILVKPLPDSTLLSAWPLDESLWADSTLIYSQASIEQLAKHLRHFINPPDCRGGSGLLRFADPLVAYFWLSSFPENPGVHLGPIEHWWVATPKQRWESMATIPWQVFSGRASQTMWDERNALLGEDQLVALEQAQHMRFIGQVHEWLGERNPQFFTEMSAQQISEWLSSNLQSGLAWGLITEQALVLWAEAFVDLGQDFTSQSVYQNWLSNESNGRLPPEIRIKAFDEYRNLQKDIAHDL